MSLTNKQDFLNPFPHDFYEWLQKNLSFFGLWDTNWIKETEKEWLLTLLSCKEQQVFNQLKNPKRALEFLAGRVLLKASYHCPFNFMPKIEILNHPSGKPFWQFLPTPNLDNPQIPFFSLAHKTPFIWCALDLKKPIGIDIEKISLKAQKVKSFFLSLKEETMLKKAPLPPQKAYTFVWAAKESLVKLLSLDFMHVARNALLIKAQEQELTFELNQEFFKVKGFFFKGYILCIAKKEKKE